MERKNKRKEKDEGRKEKMGSKKRGIHYGEKERDSEILQN
jgi:hypothetical protein